MNLCCKGKQFEIGKTYKEDEVELVMVKKAIIYKLNKYTITYNEIKEDTLMTKFGKWLEECGKRLQK